MSIIEVPPSVMLIVPIEAVNCTAVIVKVFESSDVPGAHWTDPLPGVLQEPLSSPIPVASVAVRVPHGLQDDVRVKFADAPTASAKGFTKVKTGIVATVHLLTTDKVRDGLTAMSVVAKNTATAPPPEAPAVTLIATHGAPP